MRHYEITTLRGTLEDRYNSAMRAICAGLRDVEYSRRGNISLKDKEFMAWVDRRVMEVVTTHPSCPAAFRTASNRSRRFEVRHLSGPTTEARTSLHLSIRAYSGTNEVQPALSREGAIDLTVDAQRVAKGVKFERRVDGVADQVYDRPDPAGFTRRGDDDWSECHPDGVQRTREDGMLATLRSYCRDEQEVESGLRPVAINRVTTTHAEDLATRFQNLEY